MKIYLDKDKNEWIEAKKNYFNFVDISIKTILDNKTFVVTANLDPDSLDQFVADLILIKSRIVSEKST